MIIAIDGPAGSGKSTVAKKLATDLNLLYLDTGAMYRIITFYCISNTIDTNDEQLVISNLNKINIEYLAGDFYLNGELVGNEIRDPKVTSNVSAIASYKDVRSKLVELQRRISKTTDSILDGRDIGTVVFPNATYKFYLNASAEERANRRFKENSGTQYEQSCEQILSEIIKRDEYDSNRVESPLSIAKDAIEIDTSFMNIEEVVQEIKKNISE